MAEQAPENQDQPVEETAPTEAEAPASESEDQAPSAEAESFTSSYNPDELPEEARVAYEAAYKRLQGDYTRKTQEVSQQRQEAEQAMMLVNALQNPQTQAQALQALGLELEDDGYESEDEYVDPEDRIANLEQALAAQQEAAQEEQLLNQEADYIDGELTRLAESDGRELDDQELELVVSYALANRLENGAPNVEAGYRALQTISAEAQKRHIQSKRAGAPGLGSAAEKKWDLDSEAGRKAALAEVAAAAMDES